MEDLLDLRGIDRLLEERDVDAKRLLAENVRRVQPIIVNPENDYVQLMHSAAVLLRLQHLSIKRSNLLQQVTQLQLLWHVLRVDHEVFVATAAGALLGLQLE